MVIADGDVQRVPIGEAGLTIVAADLVDRNVSYVQEDPVMTHRLGQHAVVHLGGQPQLTAQLDSADLQFVLGLGKPLA